MVESKDSASHIEDVSSEHEAVLTGVVALASLFSNCVEAFGLIHPSHQWNRDEQRQLARMGLQQARLLVWGSVLGIASPPASVTDRAVPKNPSNAYPDIAEPTFFGARDARLDDPNIRTTIEEALSAIVDRANYQTREEVMANYGLRAPKRFLPYPEPSLDPNRLESFREHHDLLREVAESYAHLSPARSSSLVHTSWQIADCSRFADFVTATREKVDLLIALLGVQEPVDRAVCMDIRAFGWHVASMDRAHLARDTSKLLMLKMCCTDDSYPQYVPAIEQALANIGRESRENAVPLTKKEIAALAAPLGNTGNGGDVSSQSKPPVSSNPDKGHLHPPFSSKQQDRKRPGLLKLFRSFGGSKSRDRNNLPTVSSTKNTGTDLSVPEANPPRSKSDAGPFASSAGRPSPLHQGESSAENGDSRDVHDQHEVDSPLSRMRSKSVGAYTQPGIARATLNGEVSANDFASSAAQPQQLQGPERRQQEDDHSQKLPSQQQDLPLRTHRDSAIAGTGELTGVDVSDLEVEADGPEIAKGPQHAANTDDFADFAAGKVIRHDQYRGIARVETRDLHQADY